MSEKQIQPGSRAPDLAKLRAAVQLRERAVRAALEHHRWVELPPSQQYARATYDAIAEILIQAGRDAAAADIEGHRGKAFDGKGDAATRRYFARIARGDNQP